jgi:hypothetical protein
MGTSSSEPDFPALAAQTGFSEAALRVLYEALRRGRGTQAQFDHPEFGGMGQWMRGGMTMVGDMFNSPLAARVAAACALLAEESAASPEPWTASTSEWWPGSLGTPSSAAEQNGWAYALFPAASRLAVRANGVVTLYDLSGVEPRGLGMQSGVLVVYTPAGPRPLESFPRVTV